MNTPFNLSLISYLTLKKERKIASSIRGFSAF